MKSAVCRLRLSVPRARRAAVAVAVAAAAAASARPALAVDYFWDTNGATPATDAVNGTWDTSLANWTTDATGATATVAWEDGNNAVFTAGGPGGTYTVTVGGTVATPQLRFRDAATQALTLTGGTITIGGGQIDSSALGTPTGRTVLVNSTLAGTGGLTVAAHGDTSDSGGSSNSYLQLGGTNTFAGDVTVTAGLVRPASDAAFGAAANAVVLNGGGLVANANLTLPNTRLITLGGTGDRVFRAFSGATFTVNGVVSGTGNLRKTDSGVLLLGAANTYTGTTVVGAGTLRLGGGTNTLPAATTVTMNGGTLDLQANSQTVANLSFPASATVSATVTGAGGTLTLGGGSTFQVGPGGALTTNPSHTLNMSGLGTFNYSSTTNNVRVGLASGTTNTGALAQVATLTLAAANNITAATLGVGDIAASNDGGASTLNLGTTNTLNLNAVNVGYSGRADATLQFAAGLTNPTVTIRGLTGGTSAVPTFNIGSVATFSGATQTSFTSTVNLSAGTVDANVTSMTIGNADALTQATRVGVANGRFTMGLGTVTVGTLTVGRIAGTTGTTGATTFTGDGLFTLGTATAAGTLNATTLVLAENTIASAAGASTRIVNGRFDLVNGTLRATTIRKGAQTGNATANVTFNWTNGTIENTAGANLAVTGVPITLAAGTHAFNVTGAQTASLDAASPIGGTGGVTKAGPGTLSLAGANTYNGGTTLSAGAVVLAAANALPSAGTVTFAGGTLDAGGFADPSVGPLSITSGASTLKLGAAGDTGNALTFAAASFTAGTLSVTNWDGLAAGGGGDRLLVTGTVPANALAAIAFVDPAGFAPGTYAATTVDAGGGTVEVVPVPEPTSAAALGTVACGLLAARRRRCRDRC
ncbi:MAG TPA: autotransporter-associated beta strand repeat-containing protein [Humisphaera sp.]